YIWRGCGAQNPRLGHRCCGSHPTVVIDGAIAEHLEVLSGVLGWGVGVRLIPRVRHAYSFNGDLLDAVDDLGLRNAGRIEDGRDDVNDVMELAANAAYIVDVTRPRHGHALGRAAEVRRYLLDPLERRVKSPRPRRRKVRERLVRPPERIPEVLSLHRHRDAIE